MAAALGMRFPSVLRGFLSKSKPEPPMEKALDRRTEHFRGQMQKESRSLPGELADIRQLGLHQALPDTSPVVLFDYFRKAWDLRAVIDKITTESTREGDEWTEDETPDSKVVDGPENIESFLKACNSRYSFKD